MKHSIPPINPLNKSGGLWKIYKITSKKNMSVVYIGSTKRELCNRLGGHRKDAKSYSNKKDKWIMENYDDLVITKITSVNNQEAAIYTEEAEILKHIEGGYEVLNTTYPTSGKKIFPNDKITLPDITFTYHLSKSGRSLLRDDM